MTLMQFLARIAILIPPPRYPLQRFAGALAPNSWRTRSLERATPPTTTTPDPSPHGAAARPRGPPAPADHEMTVPLAHARAPTPRPTTPNLANRAPIRPKRLWREGSASGRVRQGRVGDDGSDLEPAAAAGAARRRSSRAAWPTARSRSRAHEDQGRGALGGIWLILMITSIPEAGCHGERQGREHSGSRTTRLRC
jgi:hypothetical protein